MTVLNRQTFEEARKYFTPEQDALAFDTETILSCLRDDHQLSDYSFLVAPISKAYEGYLKDFFLKVGIIDKFTHESDRFRVGKTLNPSLRYKRFSIFQKLTNLHESGEELAETLWDAWKYGRNEIFHYFPKNLKNLSRSDAEERINLLLTAVIKSGQFLKTHRSDGLADLV